MVRTGPMVRYSVPLVDVRDNARCQPSGNIEWDVKDTADQPEQTSARSYRSPHSGGVG